MSISRVSDSDSLKPNIVEQGANSKIDKNTFLTLLTTQLKYQDPTNPVDSNQMAQQQVMFAELEQMMSLNSSMSSFLEQQNKMMSGITSVFNTMESTSFIGKDVSYFTDEVNVSADGDVEDLHFDLTQKAMIGYTIKNENGNIIKKVAAKEFNPGDKIELGWDGTDNAGNKVKAGKYKVEINAKDMKGKELTGKAYKTKRVDAVSFGGAMPVLVLADGSKISAAKVLAVASSGGN